MTSSICTIGLLNPNCILPVSVVIIHRVIQTIGKHVVAQQALACGSKRIRIDESTDLGIVIAGLEVVQLRVLESKLAIEAKKAGFQRLFRTPFLYLIIRKIRLICNMKNGRFVDFYISGTNAGNLG